MITLIFPHQLFRNNPALVHGAQVLIIEELLFFTQYRFHKAKLVFHRASMKYYANFLQEKGFNVRYISAQDPLHDIRLLLYELGKQGVRQIQYCELTDNWLEKRILKAASLAKIALKVVQSPAFFNSKETITSKLKNQKKLFQTTFYIAERKQNNVLLDLNGNPLGGQWTFDADNRKPWPKSKVVLEIQFPPSNHFLTDAIGYINEHFDKNPGEVPMPFPYPITFKDSDNWLDDFITNRLNEFGPYEDAMLTKAVFLNHSILSPLLNSGLLIPSQVLDAVIMSMTSKSLHLPSVEGFVRQLTGWREFIRGVYEVSGSAERSMNFFGFSRKLPSSFYDGSTGIEPIDETIKKVLKNAYVHHIERLMVIGNFMLLCEIDPDEVYQWFMELFIDAYDWVMVPNVYGMSQFADGGLMSTKPYISGSNYLLKMGDFQKGDWQFLWNALYWRFIHTHRAFFAGNPRMRMMVSAFDKFSEEKKTSLMKVADEFLLSFDD